jgi:hypothetical protein
MLNQNPDFSYTATKECEKSWLAVKEMTTFILTVPLAKLVVPQLVKASVNFKETEISFPCSQQVALSPS